MSSATDGIPRADRRVAPTFPEAARRVAATASNGLRAKTGSRPGTQGLLTALSRRGRFALPLGHRLAS